MLEITSPLGNIFHDNEFQNIESGDFERLYISRIDLEKKILRRKTDQGTDIGLKLDIGVKLRHGDILIYGETKIIVEQMPEKIVSIRLKNKHKTDVLILLGHIIGNRHRPISIQDDHVLFPIQTDLEIEVFSKLFKNIIDYVDISVGEQVFLPHLDADVYDH